MNCKSVTSVLGQDTETQTALDVKVYTLHGSQRHQCLNYRKPLWTKASDKYNVNVLDGIKNIDFERRRRRQKNKKKQKKHTSSTNIQIKRFNISHKIVSTLSTDEFRVR